MLVEKEIRIKLTEEEIIQLIADTYLKLGENEVLEVADTYPSLGEYNFKIKTKDD